MFIVTCTITVEDWKISEFSPSLHTWITVCHLGIKSWDTKCTDLNLGKYAPSITADITWLITVAHAAPAIPQPQTKMNTGSSMVFTTAPVITAVMEYLALRSALTIGLVPIVNIRNGMPHDVIPAYSDA